MLLFAAWAIVFAGSAAAAALPANCSAAAGSVTCTYTAAGTYPWTVPSGVSSLDVTAVGAAGGSAADGQRPGGAGASVEGTAVPAAGGQNLSVVVGGRGGDGQHQVGGAGGSPGGGGNAGSYPYGGNSYGDGGGGGGYSALVTGNSSTEVLAAGGGGAGYGNTGNGGNGDIGPGGGNGGAAGCGQGGDGGGGAGASGGTSGSGGAGAAGGSTGGSGTGLAGGHGGDHGAFNNSSGGGGGGGYAGGGGGGGGSCAGGGGGGSSYVYFGPSIKATASTAASVTIKYTAPPAVNPVIATSAQPSSATVGSSIADRATVSGGDSPTGTVTFALYDNSNATGTPLFTDTESLASGVATSAGYTTKATGTVYWVATYNGDSTDNSVSSGSGDEPVSVHAATPVIATSAQPSSATVGSSIADRATVSGGDSPTGTVTFALYDNSNATGKPLFTDTKSLASGVATSAGYTTKATGTVYWVATYNGDSTNNSVSSGMGDEPVSVQAPTPSPVATTPSPVTITITLASPHISLKGKRFNGNAALVKLACVAGGSTCKGKVTLRHTKTVLTVRHGHKRRHMVTVVVGSMQFAVSAGNLATVVTVPLNRAGTRLLKQLHSIYTTDTVTLVQLNGRSRTAIRFKLTLKRPPNIATKS